MQLNKHGSFYIRNGWPTKILDAVAQDNTVFSPNNELNAVDNIGVGRVMIKSMRYWAQVIGLTSEQKNAQGSLQHTFTALGKQIYTHDPYCQDIGTLWLLHRNISHDIENATAWAWAFNEFNEKSFTKDSFVDSFYVYIQKNGGDYRKAAVEKEFDCFKNTYVSDNIFDINKIIDENTIPFFAPLCLIKHCGSGIFEKRKVSTKEIPIDIALYCILSDNEKHLINSTQIDIDLLLEGKNQIGKYMNLSYSSLLELLQQLENMKRITLVNNFGNRYIQVESINTDSILLDHYQNIER